MAASLLSELQRCAAAGRVLCVLRSGCSSLPRLRLARLVTAALNPPKPPPPPYDWRRYINQFVPPAFLNPCLLVEIPFGAIGDQSPLTQWSDLVSFLPFFIRADFFVKEEGGKGAPFVAPVRCRDPIDFCAARQETAFFCCSPRDSPPKFVAWSRFGPRKGQKAPQIRYRPGKSQNASSYLIVGDLARSI